MMLLFFTYTIVVKQNHFLQIIIRTVLYVNPLKIFLPISIFIFLLGFLFFLIRLVQDGGFGVISIIMICTSIQVLVVGMLADLINKKRKFLIIGIIKIATSMK